MSLRRAGTRRAPHGGPGGPKPRTTYQTVQQGFKELYNPQKENGSASAIDVEYAASYRLSEFEVLILSGEQHCLRARLGRSSGGQLEVGDRFQLGDWCLRWRFKTVFRFEQQEGWSRQGLSKSTHLAVSV